MDAARSAMRPAARSSFTTAGKRLRGGSRQPRAGEHARSHRVRAQPGLELAHGAQTLTAAEIAERLADLPVERPEIALVVLFGSRRAGIASAGAATSISPSAARGRPISTRSTGRSPGDSKPIRSISWIWPGPGHCSPSRSPARDSCSSSAAPARSASSSRLASRRYCDTAKLRQAQRRAIQVFLEREGLA